MMTKMRKSAIAVCLAAITAVTLTGCPSSSAGTPPFGDAPNGYKGVFTLNYQSDDENAVLIQPGSVSAYELNSEQKPKLNIWYDNADSSTNACLDTYGRDVEATRRGVELEMKYVQEFGERLDRTSRELVTNDNLSRYTLTGNPGVDFVEASNNDVQWTEYQGDFSGDRLISPGFYVRAVKLESKELADGETEPSDSKPIPANSYTLMDGQGVMKKLYKDGGMISDESFAKELNVVFSDTADPDLSTSELGELLKKRLQTARANGADVTFQCIGVRFPHSGYVAKPTGSSTMQLYRMTYVLDPNQRGMRTYYILITGPTAWAERYTNNLVQSLADNVRDDPENQNGFKPESMFVLNPDTASGEETAPADTEENSDSAAESTESASAAERVIRLVPDASASAKKTSKQKNKKDDSAAETTTAATEQAAAQSDYQTSHFLFAEETDMLACFRSSDVGDFSAFAEKQEINWKQYLSCVYLPSTGPKYYPAELLTQLTDTANKEIKGAQLYQAALVKNDSKGTDLSCTWTPVSKEDFNGVGDFVQLKNEVYLKFNKQAPQQTHAWLLEIDITNKEAADLSSLINPAFNEKEYTTADEKNGSYFVSMHRGDIAEIILSAADQGVKEKYYVLILLQQKPTDALTQKAAEKQGKTGSSKDDANSDTGSSAAE